MADKTLDPGVVAVMIHENSPFFFKRFYWQLYRLVCKLRTDVWIVSLKEPMKDPLSMIYAGREINKNYLAKLAFDSSYSEIYVGRIWLWSLMRTIKKKSQNCSFMVLEVNKVFYRLFLDIKSYFIPLWIYGEVDISSSINNESLRSDIRRIKKHNLEFELTREQFEFDNFYNNLYLPYISKSHENRAFILSYDEMKKDFRRCELILIKKEKEKIGGILINYKKAVPRLWSIGVKDGNTEILKTGVIGALYYFAVEHLKQKGYKKVHFGSSRAFLKDGVLRYKKKWEVKIIGSTKSGFMIKPLSLSMSIKKFLINNPFIYINQKRYTGAIFLDSDLLSSKESFERHYKDYSLRGVSELVFNLFGESKKSIEEKIPVELSSKIKICSAERYFNKHEGVGNWII